VFVADQGKAVSTPVQLGQATQTQTEVSSGLQPGQLVITTGLNALKDGTAISVLGAPGGQGQGQGGQGQGQGGQGQGGQGQAGAAGAGQNATPETGQAAATAAPTAAP
jgi:hypothetical protein